MKKIKLNLGCGLWLKKDYINVDKFYTEEQLRSGKPPFSGAIVEKGAKFVQCDIGKMPFPDNYADYVVMNQVVEHFPMRQIATYMKEIYRVMKPGGKLVFTTPSFNGVVAEWLEMVVNPPFNPEAYLDLAEVIYGNQLAEGEMHRCPITPEFINFILTSVGFKKGTIYIARKGTPISAVTFLKEFSLDLFHRTKIKKSSVFRNDNIVVECEK